MERRLAVAMVVGLARVQDRRVDPTEVTYTENVSAHGACVISKDAWQSGDVAQVTSLKDQRVLRAKVIHCRKCSGDRYAIGLTFQGRGMA